VVIWIWISDPRSLRSWYIKEADESVTRVDSSVSLMYHDLSDLGSLFRIQITTKEGTPKVRVHTGPRKPGKFWNFTVAFSRTGKSWKRAIGPGKFWKSV